MIALSTTDSVPPAAPPVEQRPPSGTAAEPASPKRRRAIGSVEVLCVVLILVGVLHRQVGVWVADARLQT
ncbi:permease, partial [Micromonospora sp. NPDC048999]